MGAGVDGNKVFRVVVPGTTYELDVEWASVWLSSSGAKVRGALLAMGWSAM